MHRIREKRPAVLAHGVLLSIALSCPAYGFGKDSGAQGPQEIGLQDLAARLTDVLRYAGEDSAALVDRVYPLGFSKRGNFAYVYAPADEAHGYHRWSFRVVSLVSDKPVERFDRPDAGKEQAVTVGLKHLLPEIMRRYDREVKGLLRRHEIIVSAPTELSPIPYLHRGDSFSVLIGEPRDGAHEDPDELPVFLSTIRLRSSALGTKVIATPSDIAYMGFKPNYRTLGCLKSPYEDRIVVLLEKAVRGYEGPPHVRSFRMIGASLSVGFPKRRTGK